MLIHADCIPCILEMTISSLRKISLNEEQIQEILADVINIPALQGRKWDITSADVVESVMKRIYKKVGSNDPFYNIKMLQNEKVQELYPLLKDWIQAGDDPLHSAIYLATIGNAIDFMISADVEELKKLLNRDAESSIPEKNYKELREKLTKTDTLVYFSDNAGEIVFDKLLIETIKSIKPMDVAVVVRSEPTLNDATLKDAHFIKMDEVATVIENGINGPLPGTVFSRCSDTVMEWVKKADIIISKGGGNFDTIDEQKESLQKDITFMLMSKCFTYENRFGIPKGQPVLFNYYISK